MKKKLTKLFQIVIVLIGIVVLAFMLWEPNMEGVNAHATLFEIYFKDPFLAYAYASSLLFFVSLYQTIKLLGYAEKNQLASQNSIKALVIIKNCSLVLAVLIAGAVVYLFITVRGKDDIAGGMAMGSLLILISLIMAFSAHAFRKRVQKTYSTSLAAG